MKNDGIYKLKTLFDPYSPEWEDTNYNKKIELINKILGDNKKMRRDASLQIFTACARYLNSNNEYVMPESEYMIELDTIDSIPVVQYNNLLLAVGLYLNKRFVKNFEFPDKIAKAELLASELEFLKDQRRKKTQFVNYIILTKCNNNTLEFFDLYGYEGKSSTITAKIKKLKDLYDSGVVPIDALFSHVYKYESLGTYDRVVKEAPYSAFALC